MCYVVYVIYRQNCLAEGCNVVFNRLNTHCSPICLRGFFVVSRNPSVNYTSMLFGGTEIVGGPDCSLFTFVSIDLKVWHFKLMNWVSDSRWWLLKIGLRLPSMLA